MAEPQSACPHCGRGKERTTVVLEIAPHDSAEAAREMRRIIRRCTRRAGD